MDEKHVKPYKKGDCQMRHIKLFISYIVIFYFIIVSISFAEPVIQSASGQFVHKETITITGANFGDKVPAAPLLWDDAEGKTVDSDSAVVGGADALYSEANPRISNGGANYEPARTRYRTIPYRNTEAPHPYSNQYLSGGHYTYPNNNPPYIGVPGSGREQYMNVLVTVDSGVRDKKTWFATWYYRLDPQWLSPCIAGTNHKLSVVNGGSTAWSQPSGGYDVNRGQNTAPCGNEIHLSIRHESGPCDIVDLTESVVANNPRLQWVRYQRIQHSDPLNGMREIWVDNKKVIWYKDDCKYNVEDTRSFTIGGYFRWTTDVNDLNTYLGCADCYRYFDDMYVDTTFSRVILANNQNYESATIAEPQIPSAWSSDSINCTINIGKLTNNSTAYLFVFDESNNHNAIGYPIQIGNSEDPVPPSNQPYISSVSGNFFHGNSIVIGGSQFDSKNPATPLVWDDGSTNTSISTYYDYVLPENADQGSEYNMAYHLAPFRNINPPNERIKYILGGAHATDTESNQYSSGGNVVLGKDMTSHSFYVNYYYRIDPLFDEHNRSGYSDNLKELSLSETAGDAYGGTFGFYNWCNNTVPDINFTGSILMSRKPVTPENRDLPYGCSGNNRVYHNNPINEWIKMQWEGKYDSVNDSPTAILTTYPDGARAELSHYDDALTTSNYMMSNDGYPKQNSLNSLAIGGFTRIPRHNNGTNSFRYFAAVYIDNTHSRIMLGDNPNYELCTIMEPQIPSSWNNNSVGVNVNLGSFSAGSTAYLFVFNSDNQHNQTGYPVTILSGGGELPGTPPSQTTLAIIDKPITEDNSPSINISVPSNTGIYNTTENTIQISGNAFDDIEISDIAWNNNTGGSGIADNSSGDWTLWTTQDLALQEGANTITLTITDSTGQTSIDAITITYIPDSNGDQPCGNNLLVGVTDNLSSEGSMNSNVWKAFRWQADSNGTANCVKLNVVRMTGDQSSKDLAYAVYEDSDGEVGDVMTSGTTLNYNWETIGSGMHSFSLNTVHTTRNIESGKWYWIALTTETNRDLWFERASNSNALKRGTLFSSYDTIPTGSSFDTSYANNNYGWSVWE